MTKASRSKNGKETMNEARKAAHMGKDTVLLDSPHFPLRSLTCRASCWTALLSWVVLPSLSFLLSTWVRFFHIKVGVLKDEMAFATLDVIPDLAGRFGGATKDEVSSTFIIFLSISMSGTSSRQFRACFMLFILCPRKRAGISQYWEEQSSSTYSCWS